MKINQFEQPLYNKPEGEGRQGYEDDSAKTKAFEASLDELQERLGYEFENHDILVSALSKEEFDQSTNEGMIAFAAKGDKVLNAYLDTYDFQEFDEAAVPHLKTLFKTNLYMYAVAYGLFLQKSSRYSVEKARGSQQRLPLTTSAIRMQADAYEALLGAITYDSDATNAESTIAQFHVPSGEKLQLLSEIYTPDPSVFAANLQELMGPIGIVEVHTDQAEAKTTVSVAVEVYDRKKSDDTGEETVEIKVQSYEADFSDGATQKAVMHQVDHLFRKTARAHPIILLRLFDDTVGGPLVIHYPSASDTAYEPRPRSEVTRADWRPFTEMELNQGYNREAYEKLKALVEPRELVIKSGDGLNFDFFLDGAHLVTMKALRRITGRGGGRLSAVHRVMTDLAWEIDDGSITLPELPNGNGKS